MSVIAQPHDLPTVDGEDGEELTVQLDSRKLFARFIMEAEDDVILVGDELERVHLVRERGAGPEPGKDLLASAAGDRAGDVLPGHAVWLPTVTGG